ncbi:hypothetical protein EJP69_22580 [Variovorax gossypii]|uniref:Uncharacterized protein n=1 Tax=Variovorax gossypii TaxID=1679495 RepID=A0A431TFC5_9BURK|nr:hypothetical protein [Variovorax paradoxus]RTQ32070.1 hypothetical protein EJP69_22580 [Variovorax gossypii]
MGVSSRGAALQTNAALPVRFSPGKAPPPDAAHPFRKSTLAAEKTKKPEPVVKPIRALLPDASLAALAAGVV